MITRFAPSPTGLLHLGHAYSALVAWELARAEGGRFLLRIEDIDATRCREEYVAALEEDLGWLGLSWPTPRRQSRHLEEYRAALAALEARGLLYHCFCTRKEIAQSASAPHGADGSLYHGACRHLSSAHRQERLLRGDPFALRLDVTRALAQTGPLLWRDREKGEISARPERFGDVVLARKETPTSYHLAVTLDDHVQGVTMISRGEDLFEATHVHRLLQALLGLETPEYRHHRLLTDAQGQRYAKRDRALTLRSLREGGRSPEEVRGMVGLTGGVR